MKSEKSFTTSAARGAKNSGPTHEEISHRAQELWEKYNRPSGRDEEIWLEAERQLSNETSGESMDTASSARSSSMGASRRSGAR